MGVQNLWQILAPVKSTESIDVLKGRMVAVDLAIWLVESQVTGIKMMQGRVIKPHLRNLFFRVSNFLRLGVKLVFVIDGTPPELKWEEIARRNEARVGGGSRGGWRGKDRRRGGGVKKASRSHFTSWLKECQELLELMGVPCIQSKGEAEAMCAALNSAGMVDGCMTEDGDVFLYGAQVVYRNLNMATGEVDCYSMDDIRRDLNLDRRRLIALAILLGCDYLPKGVPGVGKEVAMRFMNSLPSSADPLNLFQSWKGGCDSDSQTSEERSVKKKCLRVEGFPNDDVIKEFFQNKEKPSTCHMEWKRPLLLHLMQFNLVKMEWPIGYTQEKAVPLVTLYDLTHLTSDPKGRLHPASIVKLRVRQGVQCVEVKWHKPEEHEENDEDPDTFYTTVEERERFASAHPTMMQDFVVAMETKKVKGRGKKKQNSSSSSQQEGLMVDEASQHAYETNVPVTFDLQLPPKVNPEPPHIPSYPGIKQDGRELTSVYDDDEMMKRLIRLSLHDGGTRAEEGNERRGRGEQRCRKDDTMQKRTHRRKKETQDQAKKISRKKESSKGKDNTEDSSSVQLTQEGIPSMKSTCQVDAHFANGLGTEETVKTIPDILKVVEDIDKEGSERRNELEEEQSFIEVLPLSQRLGCHSLQGFIPNSRRNTKNDSGSALKNAKQCASLSSTDDESEEGIYETLQFPEETLETDRSRLVHITKTKNRDLGMYSSIACAGSPQPSIAAGKYEGCSSEGSIDQRQIGVREALKIVSPNGFKDKLKPTPACREDTTIDDHHTQPHLPNLTDEVIDLTGDSPLNDQRTSPVYSSEVVESTAHRLPSGRVFGIKHRSSDEIDFDVDSSHSLEDFTTFKEKPEPETISSVAFGHEQSRCRVGHNQSSFMKLDNSLAKFMNELSLVSKSATGCESFLEGDDSVFVIEDAECCLEDGQEITNMDERNGDKMKGLNNSYQCSARRQSSKGHANPPVLEGSDVVCDEEVTVKVLQSESTKTEEVGDIPKDHKQDRTNNYLDSSEVSRLPIEFTLENGETRNVGEKIVHAEIENIKTRNVGEKIGHAEIENIAVSKQPQGKMREKSCNGGIRKPKKRKAVTRNSLLIENDLLKILQTMSPVTGRSSFPGQRETVLPLEHAQAAEDLSSCSSHIDSKQGCPGSSARALSSCFPTSSSTHHSESQHETIGSCTTPSSSASFMSGSISTITPTLPRTNATANSKCSTLSISGEPQPTITISSQESHIASPSTKSSHLLREQLLAMLSQLTPGNSPLMGTKVIQKSQDLLPSCVGSQKSSGVGTPKVVKDDPAHTTRGTLKTSTQHNHFQQISTTRTNGKCECDSVNSNVCGEETKSSPKLCKGDKCKPKPTRGSHSLVGESVSHNVCKPRTELKPRSHSQPSAGPGVTTKRSRSKPRSCSQPVRSGTKSRSKKSLRGSQKRESMLVMESNLGKILEGLSSPL